MAQRLDYQVTGIMSSIFFVVATFIVQVVYGYIKSLPCKWVEISAGNYLAAMLILLFVGMTFTLVDLWNSVHGPWLCSVRPDVRVLGVKASCWGGAALDAVILSSTLVVAIHSVYYGGNKLLSTFAFYITTLWNALAKITKAFCVDTTFATFILAALSSFALFFLVFAILEGKRLSITWCPDQLAVSIVLMFIVGGFVYSFCPLAAGIMIGRLLVDYILV